MSKLIIKGCDGMYHAKDFGSTHKKSHLKISNELILDFLNLDQPVKYFILPLIKAYTLKPEKQLVEKLGYLPYTPQKVQQGEKLLIDLLSEVKKDEEELEKIQRSIQQIYEYLNDKNFKNTPFLKYRLLKGIYLIANLLKENYKKNILTEEDVYKTIKRIAMASEDCEKMLREAVETLIIEFSDVLDQEGILKVKEQDDAVQEVSILFMQMKRGRKEDNINSDFELDTDFIILFNRRLNDSSSPLRRIVTDWGNEIYELVKDSEDQNIKNLFESYVQTIEEDHKKDAKVLLETFLSDYIITEDTDGKIRMHPWALMIFLHDHEFLKLKKVSEELYESMYSDRREITLFKVFKRELNAISILIDFIYNEEFELAKELVELGVEVNSDNEYCPLYYAFEKGNKELIISLLQAGAKVDLEYEFAYKLLLKSVFDWDQDEFDALIKNLVNLDPNENSYINIKEVQLFCRKTVDEVITRLTQLVNLGIMDLKNIILVLTCGSGYKLLLSRHLRNDRQLAEGALLQIAAYYLDVENQSKINLKDFEDCMEFLLRHVGINFNVGVSWKNRLLIYLSMLGESDLVSNLVNNTTSNDFDQKMLLQARDCAQDFKTKNVLCMKMQKDSTMLRF